MSELTLLVLRKLAASVEDETLRVREPDLLASLVFRHALELEEAHELHGDTDASGAGTEEEDAVVLEGTSRSGGGKLGSVHEARENDGTSTLDVIVENGVAVAEKVEKLEGLDSSGVINQALFFTSRA